MTNLPIYGRFLIIYSIGATLIKLNLDGKEVLVDDEDASKIQLYKWKLFVAKSAVDKGYFYFRATVDFKGKRVRMFLHRFIMECDTEMFIDHIDGNTLDNRKGNLRVCTRTENTRNRTTLKRNISGYRGVSYRVKHKRWYASIKYNRHTYWLHSSDKDPKECALVYDQVGRLFFGEYFRPNFPDIPYDEEYAKMIVKRASSGIRVTNKSGYKGVQKYYDKWRAYIYTKDKDIYLGTFNTPEQANETIILYNRSSKNDI